MSLLARTGAFRTCAVMLLGLLTVMLLPTVALAHPLGNATVNHYDGLHLYPDRITDAAVEDIAEIPTFQRQRALHYSAKVQPNAPEQQAYARMQCDSLASSLSVRVNGRAVTMRVNRSTYQLRPGAIGLPASRLDCELTGAVDLTRPATLAFSDTWDSQGIGWHEITAIGTGITLQHSPFPAESISQALHRYPNDLLSSPLDVRTGTVSLEPGAGTSTYAPRTRLTQAGPFGRALNNVTNAFNRLVGTRHLTLGVGLLAVLLAIALGAGHALLPGHGKTIMAAYLVGRRGRLRDVFTVGATVTLTHTAGVLLLGLALTTTAAFAPTQAEQYLGAASGLIIATVGIGLLASAVRRARRDHSPSGHAPLEQGTAEPDSEHVAEYALALHSTTVTTNHPSTPATTSTPIHRHPHHAAQHAARHADKHAQHGSHEHHSTAHTISEHHHHGPPTPGARFSKAGLVGLGVAGGLVPSPSALLVLLAAIALGRTYFGVLLVLGYGLGMAASLSAAGLLLMRLRGRLDKYLGASPPPWATRLLAVLPVMTALLVLAVGTGLTLRALGHQV